MYVVLGVGLVAVIVVIVVYVVLSVRLGRDDDEDDVLEEMPRGREQRGRDDQRWADDRPRRVPVPAGRTASGRGGAGSGYRERRPDRDAGRSRGDHQRAGVGHDPGAGRRSAGGRDRSEGWPQGGNTGRYGAAAQHYDTPRQARPAQDDYPSGDLGPLEFPTGDYPSAEFAAADYPSGAFPRPDYPPGEFPSSEFSSAELAAVRAEDVSDYPSGELSLARSSSRRADRAAAPARRGGADSRRKDGRQRESAKPRSQRSKRDDDGDWGSTDWDKLSDEQYWAELSADKPLAATTRGPEPSGRSDSGRSDSGRSDSGRSEPARADGRSASAARREAAKAKPPRPEPARPAAAQRAGSRPAGPAREDELREEAEQAASAGWPAERAPRSAGQDLPTQRLPVRDRQQRRERPGAAGPAPEAAGGSHEPGPPRPQDEHSVAMLASLAGGPAGKPADLMDDDPLTSPSFSRKAIPVLDSRSYANARRTGQTGPMPAIAPAPDQHEGPGHPQPAEPYVYPAPVGGPGYQAAPYPPAPADYAAGDYSGPSYQAAPADPGYLPPAAYPAPEYGYPGGPPAPAIPLQVGEWYAPPAEPAPAPALANPYAGYAETPAPAYPPDPASAHQQSVPPAGVHQGDHAALYGYGYPEPTAALGYQGMPSPIIGEQPAPAAFPAGQAPMAPQAPDQGGWIAGYAGDPAGAAIQGGYPDPYAPEGYGGYHPQG